MNAPLEILLWSAACATTAAGWIWLALRVRRHLRPSAPSGEISTGRDA